MSKKMTSEQKAKKALGLCSYNGCEKKHAKGKILCPMHHARKYRKKKQIVFFTSNTSGEMKKIIQQFENKGKSVVLRPASELINQ